jgi:hypothetical protein
MNQGNPGVQFNEKTEGRKSRETVPLIEVWYFTCYQDTVSDSKISQIKYFMSTVPFLVPVSYTLTIC